MIYRFAAELTMLAHIAFVVFVAIGFVAVLRWPRLAWLHVPCVAWGAYVELAGRICPLTYWENDFRRAAGAAGYDTGFLERYIYPILYPTGLTRAAQVWLAAIVIAINLAAYVYLVYRWRAAEAPGKL